LEAFRQELSKLGWIEGKNITIEYRFAEQKNERLPELAAELVRLRVDLIVISGRTTPLAAKGATTTIPIVMTQSVDPRGRRFGCQPGAAGRQCHWELRFRARAKYQKAGGTQGCGPRLSRVGLLRTPTSVQWKEIRPAALALKLNWRRSMLNLTLKV
jgi:putative ABC transport system substrate-binding protein